MIRPLQRQPTKTINQHKMSWASRSNVTLRDRLKGRDAIDPKSERTHLSSPISHLESPLELSVMGRLNNDEAKCRRSEDHIFLYMEVDGIALWFFDNERNWFVLIQHNEENWVSTAPPKAVWRGVLTRLEFRVEHVEVPLEYIGRGDTERYAEKGWEMEILTIQQQSWRE